MAVIWRNLDDDGECDESTTHIARQVKKGHKYIYQKWFYEKPILPQYQDDALVYCDLSQSCREYVYNVSTTMAVKLMKQYNEAVDFTEAFKYCEQALQKQPLHAPSLILYADGLHKLGYSLRALSYILRAIKMHPRNKDAIEILRQIVESLSAH
ncbi:uncharacterized protein LOC114516898 [Dendronephthya gigantea]|uniref:uncharacterized protein LOC114516898 n=1 Tax=Dendronephthya gigantea TaxID=151771 RepID=UPI00106C000A|nr:uncharacterized protein LOC114516898 [Dendronephthya gigantea]